MIVGYVFQNLLGFVLAFSLWLLRKRTESMRLSNSNLTERWTQVAARGCGCFYDSSIFFTFSIQLASIVMLIRLDFGISASGMGDSTAKINWAVLLLTMVPLMYAMCIPGLLQDLRVGVNQVLKRQAAQNSREKLRFFLFIVCWLLSVYPFFSKMINTFGPKFTNSTRHPVMDKNYATTNAAWDMLQTMCIGDVQPVTNAETLAMNFFGITGSLFVSLCAVIKLALYAVKSKYPSSALLKFFRQRGFKAAILASPLSSAFFLIRPVIAISQIWTVLRLRQYQQQISTASDNQDLDDQRTFGQVAATTVFVPVLIECCFEWFCR